jgi:hypothetical protein
MNTLEQINGWQTLDTPMGRYYRLGRMILLEYVDPQGVRHTYCVGKL